MTKYLLIDGYNIIFAWDELINLADSSLDHARVRLSNILSNFSGFTNEHIILVFDAHKVNGGIENVGHKNNITTVYTKEKETADTFIERAARVLAKKYFVRVATSDITEQIVIIGYGVYVVSAGAFESEVKSVTKKISEITKNRPVKNNMLIDNLDPKTAEKLEELRNKKR